jgi:hypothetical protein
MKRALAVLFFGLFAIPFALAQTAPTPTPAPASTPLQFNVTTEATMWHGAGHSEAGTDAVGILQVSPHWSARTDNIVLPGPGVTMDTIGAQGCNIPKTSSFQFCGNGGFGAVTSPAPAHYAFNLGSHLNYKPAGSSVFSFQVFDVQYIHGGIMDGTESTSNSVSLSVGINITIP